MASRKILVSKTIATTKKVLQENKTWPDDAKVVISSLLEVLSVVSISLGLTSSNSSKPPSSDPNRIRRKKVTKGKKRKPGGQKGHIGSRLEPVTNPTVIEVLEIDRRTLPDGKWTSAGFDKRQVIDIEVAFTVTEYQAEMLQNEQGEIFVAEFPEGVTEPAQYGIGVKSTSVYLSQFQLIPQARVKDVLETQFGLSITKGSVNNFNALAARTLREWNFEDWVRTSLVHSDVLHADETGSNLNGVRWWIHNLSNEKFTYFHIDPKRGNEAMDKMGVLSEYKGQLVHDHWKPYFVYLCTHVLCNSHHLRELERAYELENQKWAKKMKVFLENLNKEVHASGGRLPKKKIKKFRNRYREILADGNKECPYNKKTRAQSKARNLLDRLVAYEDETLRFMKDEKTPFTNNQGERDLRMNKVQQKISGCFRTERGARDFCLIRSYLSTCQKQGVHPMEALRLLLEGKKPKFMK